MNIRFHYLPLIAVPALVLVAARPQEALTAPANPAFEAKTKAKKAKPKAPKIVWRSSFDAAMKEAKRTGKPMMVDFYAEWCGPCKMLDSMTWPDARVVRAAQGFIAVKVDTDKEQELSQRYRITGLPTVMFFNARGQVVTNFIGFREPKDAAIIIEGAYDRASGRANAVPASFNR